MNYRKVSLTKLSARIKLITCNNTEGASVKYSQFEKNSYYCNTEPENFFLNF